MKENYKLNAEDINDIALGYGRCIASDGITVDGKQVGFMYRQKPQNDSDSAWYFMVCDEDKDYLDGPVNFANRDVNTLAYYDPDIIKYLNAPAGSQFERNEPDKIVKIEK